MFKASQSKLLQFNSQQLDIRYQKTSISLISCILNRARYYLESIVGNGPTEVKVCWYTDKNIKLDGTSINTDTKYGRFLYSNFTNKKLHSALQTCFNNLVNSEEKRKQLELNAPDGFYKFAEDGTPELIKEFETNVSPEAFLVETTIENKNSEIVSPIFQLKPEDFNISFTKVKTLIKNNNGDLAKVIEVPDTLCHPNMDNQVI